MKIEVDSQKFLQSFKQFQKEIAKSIIDGSKEAGKFLEGKIKESGFPVASGSASKSITTETTVTKNYVLTLVGADAVAYTSVIEEGRRPGRFPNLTGITKWLGRKKAIQDSLRDKFPRKRKKRLIKAKAIRVSDTYDGLDSHQKGIVFLVARKIAKKGIAGRFYFKKVRDKYAKAPNDIIFRRINEVLTKY